MIDYTIIKFLIFELPSLLNTSSDKCVAFKIMVFIGRKKTFSTQWEIKEKTVFINW